MKYEVYTQKLYLYKYFVILPPFLKKYILLFKLVLISVDV